MTKNTCKYCGAGTNNREICACCREKLSIISRIHKIFSHGADGIMKSRVI